MYDRWSNAACLGYLILAMKAVKTPERKIAKAVQAMSQVFDLVSLEEAEEAFRRFVI